MSAKQAFNEKLQGSVATYLMCGGVINNQIKKGFLLSLWVKNFLNLWIFGKVTSKNVMWLSRALSSSFSSALARRSKCTLVECFRCYVSVSCRGSGSQRQQSTESKFRESLHVECSCRTKNCSSSAGARHFRRSSVVRHRNIHWLAGLVLSSRYPQC